MTEGKYETEIKPKKREREEARAINIRIFFLTKGRRIM